MEKIRDNHSGKKLHIFFGDDDPEDIDFFQQAMKEVSPGVKMTIARDGMELLEFLQLVLPDMIFLDLNMPRMNGIDCLTLIRKEKKYDKIPVIIYSTTAEGKQIDLTYDLGANMYIQKPTRFEQIKTHIQKALSLDKKELIPQPTKEKYVVKLSA